MTFMRQLMAGATIGLAALLLPVAAEACPPGFTQLNIEYTTIEIGPCIYTCITYGGPFGEFSIPGGWVTIAGFETCYNYTTGDGIIQYFVIQYFSCCAGA